MSTLKVNNLRDTAGSADAITLDPNGGAVLAGVTTVTSVKVGAAVTISESGIEASGIGITCANINGGQIGGRRNIIINGAMMIAQRGTSATTNGFGTVDRFQVAYSGTDESPTQAQVDVSSGTDPYTEGFRKAFKITNGNQTSGAGAGDYITFTYKPEARDISNSGWNYTSTSSFITLSFWVKSSVAQTFQAAITSKDGTSQGFVFEFALSADTWTKVVKTIPGNSNLTFDNDGGAGAEINLIPFIGTTYTSASPTLNAWGAYSGSTSRKDMTSTWYTTNDATFEVTGMQLEVGPQATAFEFRTKTEELQLCKRYYQYESPRYMAAQYLGVSNEVAAQYVPFSVEMRATPTATYGSLVLRENAGIFAACSLTSNASLTSKGQNFVVGFSGAEVGDSYIVYGNEIAYDAEH